MPRLDAELAARLSEEESLELKDIALAQRLQEEADAEDEFERSTAQVATQEVSVWLACRYVKVQHVCLAPGFT